jgi:hypothetical protein
MDKLNAIPARDGTLLDHTVLLLGCLQTSRDSGGSFPMLLVGGRVLVQARPAPEVGQEQEARL